MIGGDSLTADIKVVVMQELTAFGFNPGLVNETPAVQPIKSNYQKSGVLSK